MNKVQVQHDEVTHFAIVTAYIQSTEFFLFHFIAENALLALFASQVTCLFSFLFTF
jgi:hypothetical protein